MGTRKSLVAISEDNFFVQFAVSKCLEALMREDRTAVVQAVASIEDRDSRHGIKAMLQVVDG